MTSNKIIVNAEPRTILGKKTAQLRRQGWVPANIFGLNQPSLAVQVDGKEFGRQLAANPDVNLVYLSVAGDSGSPTPALVDEVVSHPVTAGVQHIAFRRVSLKEKVTTEVPIELVGEVDVPDTTLVQVLDEIEIEALPTDIPEKIEVNIESLKEAGDAILINQLVFDKDKIALVATEEEMTQPVVILQAVVEEVEEVVEEVVETAEGEVGEKSGEEAEKEGGDDAKSEDKSEKSE